jgi:hypothetical protein
MFTFTFIMETQCVLCAVETEFFNISMNLRHHRVCEVVQLFSAEFNQRYTVFKLMGKSIYIVHLPRYEMGYVGLYVLRPNVSHSLT